jgi:integrase
MSARKLWKQLVGPKGARVMAKERTVGGSVYLFAYDAQTRKYQRRSLGFTVRNAAGALVPDAEAKAKKLAAELSNRLLAGERATHPAKPPAVTLGDVARLFERERLPRQTPRSQSESRRLLACWCGYLGAGFELARFHSASWSRFHRERAAGLLDGRGHVTTTRKPVGPNTIRKELKFLRTLCTFATEYRLADGRYLLAGDPTRGMEIPVEDDPKRPLFDENRYARLLATASARLLPLLVLAHDTGRRISAIVALRWDDWCPTAGLYGVLTWRAAHDKLGKTWNVPVTQAVGDALTRLEHRGPYLFPTLADPARSITRTVATNWLRRAERRAQLVHLPGGGWHAFRRAWATGRKHLSLKDVAYAGGWSETSTLVSIYQQPDVESLAQVVEGGREKIRAVR